MIRNEYRKPARFAIMSLAALGIWIYLLSMSHCAAQGVARPDPLEEANNLCRAGKYQEAAEAYSKILAGNADIPTKGKARFDLGVAYDALGRYADAIAEFEKILTSDVDDKEPGGELMETNRNYRHRSCLRIAGCYAALGDNQKSLEYALLAKHKHPYTTWCGTCAQEAHAELNNYIVNRAIAAGDYGVLLRVLPETEFFWQWLKMGGLGLLVAITAVALWRRKVRRRRAAANTGQPQSPAAADQLP
jgi:tetratricopeptide (TPR) repeat protein